jgi:hypothetical protein
VDFGPEEDELFYLFAVCLTTISVVQTLARNGGTINKWLEKDMEGSCLEYYLVGLRKTAKNLGKGKEVWRISDIIKEIKSRRMRLG